ncbi:YolD-like family protein [Viridibacillus sp. NPDC093762]|uniref:YolD-like family protein n=1 Tax=Viridibacillus sp. NPDC093762 TaxID=3390720 RepID=UPI003D08A97B
MNNTEWQANNDVPKPIIDEQKFEEINFIIQNALNNKLKLEVQYYSNNSLKIIQGIIDKIDYFKKNFY